MEALDYPRQVQILINGKEKKLAMRACSVDAQQAVVVPDEFAERIEISGRSLLRRIRKLVGWEDDRPRVCYGEYLPAHQAITFSLIDAEPIDLQQDEQQR